MPKATWSDDAPAPSPAPARARRTTAPAPAPAPTLARVMRRLWERLTPPANGTRWDAWKARHAALSADIATLEARQADLERQVEGHGVTDTIEAVALGLAPRTVTDIAGLDTQLAAVARDLRLKREALALITAQERQVRCADAADVLAATWPTYREKLARIAEAATDLEAAMTAAAPEFHTLQQELMTLDLLFSQMPPQDHVPRPVSSDALVPFESLREIALTAPGGTSVVSRWRDLVQDVLQRNDASVQLARAREASPAA